MLPAGGGAEVKAAPRDRQWKSGNAEFYQVLC
jgi:hypothetical protein